MMPSTTGRVMSLATWRAVPVRPSSSHTMPGREAGAPHHGGREDERLRRLRRGDGTRRLHRLYGYRRAVDEAADDHGEAECQQNAERVHLEDAM